MQDANCGADRAHEQQLRSVLVRDGPSHAQSPHVAHGGRQPGSGLAQCHAALCAREIAYMRACLPRGLYKAVAGAVSRVSSFWLALCKYYITAPYWLLMEAESVTVFIFKRDAALSTQEVARVGVHACQEACVEQWLVQCHE